MTDNANDMRAALTDVRRAYRIAVAFQQRINEVFQRFHETMEYEGFTFKWWGPNYYGTPMTVNYAPFRKWAWDMFPGFSMGGEWLGPGTAPVRRVYLSLETGRRFEKRGGEPDPAAFTTRAEDARTELWVGLWTADKAPPDWGGAWKDVKPQHLKGRWDPSQRALPEPLSWSAGTSTGTYATYRVDVGDLLDRSDVDRSLLEPARRWVQSPSS